MNFVTNSLLSNIDIKATRKALKTSKIPKTLKQMKKLKHLHEITEIAKMMIPEYDAEFNGIPHIFFKEHILEEYYNHYLFNKGNFVMLSVKDVMDRFGDTRSFEERRRYLVSYLGENCNGNISEKYIDDIVQILLNEYYYTPEENRIFDLVIFEKPNSNKALSFIITEKGECEKYPDVHVLSLICSSQNAGKFAFQLYIFTILYKYVIENQTDIFGLLELAYGYVNISGFCLYSKNGFEETEEFFSNNEKSCFDDIHNLPMVFETEKHIKQYKEEKGVNSVNNVEGIVDVIEYITKKKKKFNCRIGHDEENMKYLQSYYDILSNLYMVLKFGIDININYIYEFYPSCIKKDSFTFASYSIIINKLIKKHIYPFIKFGEKFNFFINNKHINHLDFIDETLLKSQITELFTLIKNDIEHQMTDIQECIETNNTTCINTFVQKYKKIMDKSRSRC